jgi:nitrite reductase/ring-hydroxylating ferredoxin subunit
MLRPQENERITRVGAGTPMGALQRRYWQPMLLSEELVENDGAPLRVRLLGEDLIAFRDSAGEVGLVEAYCPHRRAPMFFGRNEECGLRCVYHGWKFDRTGACVDMPSEPPDSLFKMKVRIGAYPTWEGGGIVWAYLGPPELTPAYPDYSLVHAPATHRAVTKMFQSNNWLQALEGAVDSVHFSFLHNDERTAVYNIIPRVEFERTPFGVAGVAIHELDSGQDYLRTFHFVLPAQTVRARTKTWSGEQERIPTISGHFVVPIDDEHCWMYSYLHSADPTIALPPEFVAARYAAAGKVPGGYSLFANAENDYLIDRLLQKTKSFSGIRGQSAQDVAVQEMMGAILDRSNEHLAQSDRVIIATRQALLEAVDAVEDGAPAPAADPASYRAVHPSDRMVAR